MAQRKVDTPRWTNIKSLSFFFSFVSSIRTSIIDSISILSIYFWLIHKLVLKRWGSVFLGRLCGFDLQLQRELKSRLRLSADSREFRRSMIIVPGAEIFAKAFKSRIRYTPALLIPTFCTPLYINILYIDFGMFHCAWGSLLIRSGYISLRAFALPDDLDKNALLADRAVYAYISIRRLIHSASLSHDECTFFFLKVQRNIRKIYEKVFFYA